MLNNVVLVGRLVAAPSLKYTPGNGTPVATFTLACDRPFKNSAGEREADFINIVTWRKLAENCANYLQKGSLAAVTGRLQIRSYEDSNGIKRKVAEIVADNVRFLDSRKKQEEDSRPEDVDTSDVDISEGDVPF